MMWTTLAQKDAKTLKYRLQSFMALCEAAISDRTRVLFFILYLFYVHIHVLFILSGINSMECAVLHTKKDCYIK